MISNTGYLKDSPDRFNPFNIIPSNRITMKNVNHPVLGVDDKGNIKMMSPGKDYKFKGKHVLEIPIRQTGGSAREYDNQFMDKWFSDPATEKRLSKFGYTKDSIKSSLNSLNNVRIQENKNLPKGALGEYSNNNIQLRNLKDYPTGIHELIHASPEISKMGEEMFNKVINKVPSKEEFFNRNRIPTDDKRYSGMYDYIKQDGFYPRVMEIRRALNAVPGQNITIKDLKKIQTNPGYNDLKSFYSDEEILKALNIIASNKNQTLPNAQTGGEWFEKIKSKLNPYNWGLRDYSDINDFNEAYKTARYYQDSEFLWKDKRYSSDLKNERSDENYILPLSFRKRIFDSVSPQGYPIDEILDAGYRLITGEYVSRYENSLDNALVNFTPNSDAWAFYMGIPQINKSVSESKYKPSVASEESKYYTLRSVYPNFEEIIIREAEEALGNDKTKSVFNSSFGPLENVTYSRGEDENGKYYSIYDIYDFDILGQKLIGKPYEIYDRVYYDTEKNVKPDRVKERIKKQKGGEMKKYQKGGNKLVPSLNGIDNESRRDSVLEAMWDGAGYALGAIGDVMSIPQRYIMQTLTGEYQDPSQAWGFSNIGNIDLSRQAYMPYSANPFLNPKGSTAGIPTNSEDWENVGKHAANFTMDTVLDPMNILGASIAKSFLKSGAKMRPVLGSIDLRKARTTADAVRPFPDKNVFDDFYSKMFSDFNTPKRQPWHSSNDILMHNAENQAKLGERVFDSEVSNLVDQHTLKKRESFDDIPFKSVAEKAQIFEEAPLYKYRYKDIIDEGLYNRLKAENVNPWNESAMSQALKSDVQKRISEEISKSTQFRKYADKAIDPRKNTAEAINPRTIKDNKKGGEVKYQFAGETRSNEYLADWSNMSPMQDTLNQIGDEMNKLAPQFQRTKPLNQVPEFNIPKMDINTELTLPTNIPGVQGRPPQEEPNPFYGAQYAFMGLMGMGALNEVLEKKNKDFYDEQMRKYGNTNQMQSNNPQNPYGNFTLNNSVGSNFRPNQYTKYGGEYQEGGEYDLSSEEVQRLISLGYDIELL